MTDLTGNTNSGAGRDERDDDYDAVMYESTEARRSTSEFWVFIVVTALLLFFTYDDGGDSLSRVARQLDGTTF
jgi:hypothetical protein